MSRDTNYEVSPLVQTVDDGRPEARRHGDFTFEAGDFLIKA